MSSISVPVFTLSSGEAVEDKDIPTFQPVVSRTMRVNDNAYGLKSAVAIKAEKLAREAEREDWKRGREQAIAKQRAKEQQIRDNRLARLLEVEAEIAHLQTAWESGTASDMNKTKALLLTLLDKRDRLKAKADAK